MNQPWKSKKWFTSCWNHTDQVCAGREIPHKLQRHIVKLKLVRNFAAGADLIGVVPATCEPLFGFPRLIHRAATSSARERRMREMLFAPASSCLNNRITKRISL